MQSPIALHDMTYYAKIPSHIHNRYDKVRNIMRVISLLILDKDE